jgi:hypothetical protein
MTTTTVLTIKCDTIEMEKAMPAGSDYFQWALSGHFKESTKDAQ